MSSGGGEGKTWDARSLAGMTMGARKRMFLAEAWRQLDKNPYYAGVRSGASDEEAAATYRKWVARAVRSFLLHTPHARERIRPCPESRIGKGTQECMECRGTGVLPAGKGPQRKRGWE